MPSPADFLRGITRTLTPGGVAYGLFPNTEGLNDRWKSFLSLAGLKGRRWKHLAADHHLWFFDPTSVRRLCAKLGLRVLSIETVNPRRKRRRLGPLAAVVERAGLAPLIELVFSL